jgi:hypothetical protein
MGGTFISEGVVNNSGSCPELRKALAVYFGKNQNKLIKDKNKQSWFLFLNTDEFTVIFDLMVDCFGYQKALEYIVYNIET